MYYLNETEKFSKIFEFTNDGISQDWDIEFSDCKRLNEFLNYYKKNELNNEEKITLMALIIASYDEYLNEIDKDSVLIWKEISNLIFKDRKLFEGIIYYWSELNHLKEFNYSDEPIQFDENDCFAITPLVRKTFYKEVINQSKRKQNINFHIALFIFIILVLTITQIFKLIPSQ